MANRARGEQSISIAGKKYAMALTYAAITGIEDEFDKGIIQIAVDLRSGGVSLKTTSAIVHHAIGLDAVSRSDVGQALLDMGLNTASDHVAAFLMQAFSGGEVPEKKAKAPA